MAEPTFSIRASRALHAAALIGVVVRPHLWPWMLGTVIADHLVLTAAGLWPKSTLLGSNWTRLPAVAANRAAVAITIDDGPNPAITPEVLDVLAAHRTKATFFCVGERVAEHADLAREIVRRGHTIENHSQRHLNHFSILGPRAMREEIARAQHTIAAVTGELPRFFRAPAGLRNPFLEPALSRLGLQLASWTRRGFDTVNRDPRSVLRKLTRGLAGRDILLLHDGHAALTPSGTPVILEVLPKLLDAVAAARLRPVTLRSAQAESAAQP
ncbi:MAG TPA: polysaccharide deacetylase family protein [Steroidobacteraceae bacterium]|jgi:peptidoglycan/xylan/chitin deacetylase (PgdA/CDA1 family)